MNRYFVGGLVLGTAVALLGCSDGRGKESEPEPVGQVQQAQFATMWAIPMRWCAVQGSPIADNPLAAVNEMTTDDALWRRHERMSDNIYIPEVGITLRAGISDAIRASGNLSFPIIADPDTTIGSPGDVLNPGTNSTEMGTMLTNCAAAWDTLLADPELDPFDGTTSDIGFLAVNVRRIVNMDGTPRTTLGITLSTTGAPGFGARRIVAIDPAFILTTGSMASALTFHDDISGTTGHEVGHAWPLTSPGGNVGLRHTGVSQGCAAPPAGNLMQGSLQEIDANGDTVVNGLDAVGFDTNVEQIAGGVCEPNVDQVALLRGSAPGIPGCKLFGTNTNCSSISDLEIDALQDVAQPQLDLSGVYFTEPNGSDTTEIRHELFGQFTFSLPAAGQAISYFAAFDLDNNPMTGGAASAIGMPTAFAGAEFITRVNAVRPQIEGPSLTTGMFASPTVWRFNGSTFDIVTSPGIAAQLLSFVFSEDTFLGSSPDIAGPDAVSIRIPNSIRGPRATTLRMQALSLATVGGVQVIDRLDDRPGEPGRSVETTPPSFPSCSVAPNPGAVLSTATVTAERLVSNGIAKVFVGDVMVGQSVADADGDVTASFTIPADLGPGPHLVTVGTMNTALTADCPLEVVLPPGCAEDTVPPTLSVSNVTVTACAGEAIALPVTATDQSCQNQSLVQITGRVVTINGVPPATPIIITGPNPSFNPPIGTTVILWTAFDVNGNRSTATQTITVGVGILASQSFIVNDRATVTSAGVGAAVLNSGTGLTRIGNDAQSGSVLSVGPVDVQHRAVVAGNVTSQTNITVASDATVTGAQTIGPVILPALPTLPTFPTPTLGSFTVNSGTQNRPPGSYVSGTVNGGTLVLAAGDYFFQNLTINSGVTVRVTPNTRVFVRDTLTYHSPFRLSGGAIASIFLGFRGNNTSLLAPFNGRLVAPNATVNFGTGSGITYTGSFFARVIVVTPASDLVCVPNTGL